MWEKLTHLLLRLFDREILTRVLVYLIDELSAVVNHLLHCHILRELAVLVAVDAIILVWCAIGIRAEHFICERHSAALTEFHFHIVSIVLSHNRSCKKTDYEQFKPFDKGQTLRRTIASTLIII